MTYNPRSVPLPVPIPQNKCVHGAAQRIYNLLSIAANCVEEYENKERDHIDDAGINGNLSEFEGCLESAITHWLFLFEAESLVDEETQTKIRENIAHNTKYNADREKEIKEAARKSLMDILRRIPFCHKCGGERIDQDDFRRLSLENVELRRRLSEIEVQGGSDA